MYETLALFDAIESSSEFPTHCLHFACEELCNLPGALRVDGHRLPTMARLAISMVGFYVT